MAILWLRLGLSIGVLLATIRSRAIDAENERLRQALANVRVMIQRANYRSAVSQIARALEDEAA